MVASHGFSGPDGEQAFVWSCIPVGAQRVARRAILKGCGSRAGPWRGGSRVAAISFATGEIHRRNATIGAPFGDFAPVNRIQ